jgi:hypothetical protein
MTRLLPAALCRFVGHRRSRRRAYIDPQKRVWRSYCRLCGTPLTRHGLLGWQDDKEMERSANA